MATKELNLCELLKEHEGETFFSLAYGDLILDGIHEIPLYLKFRSPVVDSGTIIILPSGKQNKAGIVSLFPSRILYVKYPLDPDTAWAEWAEWAEENKKVTYEDVCHALFGNASVTTVTFGVTSVKATAKLAAICKLMNVQKYLEKGWQPDWSNDYQQKWMILMDEQGIRIDYVRHVNATGPYFSTKDNAQKAIEILGEETIRTALSTDW